MNDRLTFVVFKDHLSSRTLTLRHAWLRVFGISILGVIALTIIAAALFLNAYRKTIGKDSVSTAIRAEELERELSETKRAYDALRQSAMSSAAGMALAGASNSFNALPADAVLEKLPPVESLNFRLEPMKAQWKGSTLQIRSAIEYTREDGGNQQGHFVILARGPEILLAYPEKVFNPAGNATLIKPDGGEYFSVSRYREIKADFGPFERRDDVQSIEIYIFDSKKRLIFLDRNALETLQTARPPEPSRARRAAPVASPSQASTLEPEPIESASPPAGEESP